MALATDIIQDGLKDLAVEGVRGLARRLMELKAVKKAFRVGGGDKLPEPFVHALESIDTNGG
jgi:hypothetical protein